MYRLALGEMVTTIPTIGFNVEDVTVNGTKMIWWDCVGRGHQRVLTRHYFCNTTAVVYMMDGTDTDRRDEAFDDLMMYLKEDELRECLWLVLVNKQDLATAQNCADIEKKWRTKFDSEAAIHTSLKRHSITFKPCSVLTEDGLSEAFEEFVNKMNEREKEKYLKEVTGEDGKVMISMKSMWRNPAGFVKSILLY